MRQYETKVRETEEIAKIVCNKCGREIPVVEGVRHGLDLNAIPNLRLGER